VFLGLNVFVLMRFLQPIHRVMTHRPVETARKKKSTQKKKRLLARRVSAKARVVAEATTRKKHQPG
jgi:hypothetical protein